MSIAARTAATERGSCLKKETEITESKAAAILAGIAHSNLH
jgi:hypothetical protein